MQLTQQKKRKKELDEPCKIDSQLEDLGKNHNTEMEKVKK